MKKQRFYHILDDLINMVSDDRNLIDQPQDLKAVLNGVIQDEINNETNQLTAIQAGLYLKTLLYCYVGPEADMTHKIARDITMNRANHNLAEMVADFNTQFDEWLAQQQQSMQIGSPNRQHDNQLYQIDFNHNQYGKAELDEFIHTTDEVYAVENPAYQKFGNHTIEVTNHVPVKVEEINDKYILTYHNVRTIENLNDWLV